MSEEWKINSYSFKLNHMSDDESLKDKLIELCMVCFLKVQFESKTLEEYWCVSMDMFPKLMKKH